MPETKILNCLIVDDDSMILSVVKECLQAIGYTCSLAMSAENALELLAEKSFSLMITDLQMGVMNGIELTKRKKILSHHADHCDDRLY